MTHLVPVLRPVLGSPFRRAALYRKAGELPSFHISPAALGHARDLISGSLLGTYNSATPAMAVGADGILYTPAANAPVIEYDATTRACLGARIWGPVTNRFLNSVGTVNVTISAATTTGPNNQLMSKAVYSAGSAIFPSIGIGSLQSFSLTSGQTIDVAIGGWLAAGSTGMQIEPRLIVHFGTGGANLVYAELQINTTNWTVRAKSLNAAITEVSAPVIKEYSPALFPGVYRVDWVVRYTQGATVRDNFAVYAQMRDTSGSGTYTSDGIGHFQFFGLQGTASSAPQPYVPTTITAASSTADVWSITGADFSRIYNQAAVTMYAEAERGVVPSGELPMLVDARNTSGAELVQIGYATEDLALCFQKTGNITQAEMYPSGFTGVRRRRVAGAFAANDAAVSANGSSPLTDTVATMPSPDTIRIGSPTSNILNGYIRELAIFRSRRPDSSLTAMTQ